MRPSASPSTGRSCRRSPTRRPRSMPRRRRSMPRLATTWPSARRSTPATSRPSSPTPIWSSRTPSISAATPPSAWRRARVLAAYDKGTGKLTIHTSSQCPHMIQRVFAHTLGMPDHKVQIVAPDVGGSFGLKIHTYGDEVAATAAAIELGRPVKFIADRLESFVSDIHARENSVKARIAVSKAGRDPGLRHRRAVGRRRLLAVSAHQRVRGQPDPQHHRRALPAQAPSRRAPPSSISTSRPPRSTAPSATRSATRSASTWSTAPRRRWGSTRSRSPPQRHARRRLPGRHRQRRQAKTVAPALLGCVVETHAFAAAAQGAGRPARKASTAASLVRQIFQLDAAGGDGRIAVVGHDIAAPDLNEMPSAAAAGCSPTALPMGWPTARYCEEGGLLR